MPDMHELIHCAPVRLPSGQHEIMYYVRPSDAERLLRKIERLRTVARTVCDYLVAEPDCCPSLMLDSLIGQLAMALATEDHGDE